MSESPLINQSGESSHDVVDESPLVDQSGESFRDVVGEASVDSADLKVEAPGPKAKAPGKRRLGTKIDFEEMRSTLLAEGRLYEDPDFLPGDGALFYGRWIPSGIQWRRPKEINGDPVFIKGQATRFDLDQGALGNCWFVAAAATIATVGGKLFARVVPQDQTFKDGEYTGMFRFNFWRFGRWEEVVVDDRLPVNSRSKLMYCSNKEEPNEFWAALCEKAYAKLYSCYEALEGGHTHDALVDMTGGISEEISLRNKQEIDNGLFELMRRTSLMNSLLGLGTPTANVNRESDLGNGIYSGHAYSLTGMVQQMINGQEVRLLRLRNPWGRSEWTGPWSDRSKEWMALTLEQRTEFNLVIRNDGEFWISFEDAMANFTQLSFCHLVPDALTEEVSIDMKKHQWKEAVHHGEWVNGISAGGCGNSPHQQLYWTNPQYQIKVDKPETTTVISLMEKDYRTAADPVAIGCDIWKVRDPALTNGTPTEPFKYYEVDLHKNFKTYSHKREVTFRENFDTGTYIVIPATFKVDQEAQFILRIYSDTQQDVREMDYITKPKEFLRLSTGESIEEVFGKFSKGDRHLDAFQLLDFLNSFLKKDISDDVVFTLDSARSLVAMLDVTMTGSLEIEDIHALLQGANIKAWKQNFMKFDKDNSGSVHIRHLREIFNTLGYGVSRKILAALVRRYAGKRRAITFPDFIICLAKLTTMYERFNSMKKPTEQKLEISLDDWLVTTLYY